MSALETRWPCPVCLGVKLEKLRVGEDGLVLDHCPRCGGVWFELGEVEALRSEGPRALEEHLEDPEEIHHAQCHECRAFVERDADECPVCGTRNRLDCPACGRAMDQVAHADLMLDICGRCRGVWFDAHEIGRIWELERDRLVARYGERGKVAKVARDGSEVLLDSLVWAPDLVLYGTLAAGEVASSTLRAAPSILEGIGEAAGGVFEAVVDIIGGLFG